jgi:ABC-type glycerol-3-phosphate transport system substrate-binding protein
VVVVATMIYSELLTRHYDPPGPVHVTYWEKWTGFEGDAMRDVVDYYNKSQNKIHVDLLTISGIEQKTLMATAAGVPPDVAGLYGPNVAQYADDHAVMQLDDLCKAGGITPDRYIPAYWDVGVYHNHIYSLPTTPASTALHYNYKMLQAAGYDPQKPPQTIEEMDQMVDKLTKRNSSGQITQSGFIHAEPGWWNWCWGYMFGGRLWDGKSKITANSPENIRAFEWIASYSKKYGPNAIQSFKGGFGSFSSPQNAFLSSKVAMELQGVWMSNFIGKFAPDLAGPPREWGAAPFPYPADRPDLANSTLIDEDVLVIPRGSRHVKEAFDFISFVESQKGMEMLCMGQRKHTPLVDVSPEFYAHHPNPFIKLFSTLPRGKNTYFPPKIGIWPEYTSEMNVAFDQVQLLKKTPKEALQDVQDRMQPKLDEYLERLKQRGEAEQ